MRAQQSLPCPRAVDGQAVAELLRASADQTLRTHTWGSCVRGSGSGQTAVHWAADAGCVATLRLLLDTSLVGGAELDDRGSSPAALAEASLASGRLLTRANVGSVLDAVELLKRRERERWLCVQVRVAGSSQADRRRSSSVLMGGGAPVLQVG